MTMLLVTFPALGSRATGELLLSFWSPACEALAGGKGAVGTALLALPSGLPSQMADPAAAERRIYSRLMQVTPGKP